LVRPVIAQARAVAGEGVQLAPPGLATTEYPVMVDPPFELGADQRITTCFELGVALGELGAPGTSNGVVLVDDERESPASFVAMTLNE